MGHNGSVARQKRSGRAAIETSVFVIGIRGEVGRRFAAALARAGWDVRPVTRDDGWEPARDASDPAPRVVAVREEALAGVLERLGRVPRERLVLVQNGFLEAVHGDLGPVTRALIYFTSKAELFHVLCESPVHGPLAGPMAAALHESGIASTVVDGRRRFLREMLIKGFWNSIVGLPLAVHRVELEDYLLERRLEIDALAVETMAAAGAEYGIEVPAREAVQKLFDTTGQLGALRGGAKALAWRNGAVAWFGRRHAVATTVTDRLLRAAGYDPASRPSEIAAR